ncbi:MAG: sigma-54-dependent Fis family transcriptional regulator, partial [Candidatus Cloacimonetes bacterium]|nr:sigma-54-dependent Fis family transcriptional regulator [Candidatus Cloacimonadota bacterium]
HIPALRDRIDDIPDLLEFFTNRYSAETNKRKPTINDDFIERLSKHTFPGNVRELKNYVERLFILHYRSVWDASILDNISTFSKSQQPAQVYDGKDIKSIEAEIIIQALKQAKGKQKTAALILNMTESTLSRKIKRLGIVF